MVKNSLNADHAATAKGRPAPPHKYNPYPILTIVAPHIAAKDTANRIPNMIYSICFTVLDPIRLEV